VTEAHAQLGSHCIGSRRRHDLRHGFIQNGAHDSTMSDAPKALEILIRDPLSSHAAVFVFVKIKLHPAWIAWTAGEAGGNLEFLRARRRFAHILFW